MTAVIPGTRAAITVGLFIDPVLRAVTVAVVERGDGRPSPQAPPQSRIPGQAQPRRAAAYRVRSVTGGYPDEREDQWRARVGALTRTLRAQGHTVQVVTDYVGGDDAGRAGRVARAAQLVDQGAVTLPAGPDTPGTRAAIAAALWPFDEGRPFTLDETYRA